MPICVAVPHETVSSERRVALVPAVAEQLAKQGVEILLQAGAGAAAFYRDDEYTSARLTDDRTELLGAADILLTVQPLDEDAIGQLREQWDDGNNTLAIEPGVVIAYQRNQETNRRLRDAGVEVLELELVAHL